MKTVVEVVGQGGDYAGRATRKILQIVLEAVKQRGRASISLSGGTTPKRVYEVMAEPQHAALFPWEKMHFFWGDERWVPQTDERSNFKMVHETLLSKISIPPSNIHPMRGVREEGCDEGAVRYEWELRKYFACDEGFPRFDLMLLGLGDDGHTASLFPGEDALHEEKKMGCFHCDAKTDGASA